ncbi:MAG: dehydrogenase E1 component subunit alpha/beta [Ignavibacteriales bacterium]|nr:dehydrogenase E1 component subunit alpha/beta [Ignavibacteriales bacterium]MBK7377761.1 dehydrogenase E1 component subunit alpha/beta [Ignavibacteriales bacterium]
MSKNKLSNEKDITKLKKLESNKSSINDNNKNHEVKSSLTKNLPLNLTSEKLLSVLRLMLLSRAIDNKAMNLLRQGKTFFHISGSGHEAIQTAVGLSLDHKIDWIFPYYRDLGLVLTFGLTPHEFFLQCFAKASDPASGGRQLPTHWGHTKINLPSQSSPTGTQFLQAVGAALASVKKGNPHIAYVSSGEGTTSQGEFHEAINWASREKLPVMFVIQNNGYAISVPVKNQSGGKDNSIAEMMAGYHNLLRINLDGTNFFESYEKVQEAVKYINEGNGPVLIEANVVRLQSHSSSDDQKKYRDHKELDEELKRDPIDQFSKWLIKEGLLSVNELEKIKFEITEEVNAAADKALAEADPNPADAAKFVFDESGLRESLEYEMTDLGGEKIVMVDAINHALREEMEINDKIYVFGEDIADGKGGVFTATKGLSTKFGNERVFNSPLAEASIAGVATGMALAGLKPVVEIQFGDYIWPAFMQLRDETATMRYRSNNNWISPVVVRVAVGGYIHGGLYHSQNIESFFAHVPGIFIAYPSNAADAKGLLKTAIRINDPVLFCEHKGLYRQSYAITPEPNENYLVPFGKAKVVKEGSDLTVISYGAALWDCVTAAKKLEDEGHSVEVIDLRTIIPIDEEMIFKSVKKTNKCIIVHEDTLTGGFGGEIAARVADTCFQYLDGPVRRIAALDSHIPYSPILESAVLPSRDVIYNGIKSLLNF